MNDQRLWNDTAWDETEAMVRELEGTPLFMLRAKCRGMGHQPDNPFYSEYRDNQGVARAKAICRGTESEEASECPVRYECLKHAIFKPEPTGVWGGVSERERRRIRREIGLILSEPEEIAAAEDNSIEDEPVASYTGVLRYQEGRVKILERRPAPLNREAN